MTSRAAPWKVIFIFAHKMDKKEIGTSGGYNNGRRALLPTQYEGEMAMVTIETVGNVGNDGILTVHTPGKIPPGPHRVVVVLDETPLNGAEEKRLPDMAAFRKSLGATPYPGNFVAEMREGERS